MLKTLSVLWLGSLLGAGAAFLTQVILARQLGPAEFGAFAAALAAVTLVAPLATFGVGGFWLKVFGKEGWGGLRWVQPSVVFSSLSTLCVMALILVWALLGPHDGNSTQLFNILSIYIVGQAIIEITSARFQLEERYTRLALWQFMPHALRLAGVGFLSLHLGSELSATAVAIAYAVVAMFLLVFGTLPIGQMMRGAIALKGHDKRPAALAVAMPVSPGMVAVVRETWPFGLAGFFFLIYFQSNIVLLKYLAGDEQAGLYNVAFVVMAAAYMFPAVIYQKYLLPKIHRWSNHDRSRLRETFYYGNKIMFVFGIIGLIVLLAFAQWGVEMLFGNRYEGAVNLLMVLALAVPARFVSSNAGAILMTKDNLIKKIIAMAFIAVFNIVLNVALIPEFGAMGASISTVISEVALLIIFIVIVRRHLAL